MTAHPRQSILRVKRRREDDDEEEPEFVVVKRRRVNVSANDITQQFAQSFSVNLSDSPKAELENPFQFETAVYRRVTQDEMKNPEFMKKFSPMTASFQPHERKRDFQDIGWESETTRRRNTAKKKRKEHREKMFEQKRKQQMMDHINQMSEYDAFESLLGVIGVTHFHELTGDKLAVGSKTTTTTYPQLDDTIDFIEHDCDEEPIMPLPIDDETEGAAFYVRAPGMDVTEFDELPELFVEDEDIWKPFDEQSRESYDPEDSNDEDNPRNYYGDRPTDWTSEDDEEDDNDEESAELSGRRDSEEFEDEDGFPRVWGRNAWESKSLEEDPSVKKKKEMFRKLGINWTRYSQFAYMEDEDEEFGLVDDADHSDWEMR